MTTVLPESALAYTYVHGQMRNHISVAVLRKSSHLLSSGNISIATAFPLMKFHSSYNSTNNVQGVKCTRFPNPFSFTD